MLDTVKSFDHKTGYKLTTYLNRHLLNRWAQMLGVKHGREKFDPLNRCISLESTIAGENKETALGEVIPDKAAEQAIESSFERVYTQQLHDVLESCLDTLKPTEADTDPGAVDRGKDAETNCRSARLHVPVYPGSRNKRVARPAAWGKPAEAESMAGRYHRPIRIQNRVWHVSPAGRASVEITAEKLDSEQERET